MLRTTSVARTLYSTDWDEANNVTLNTGCVECAEERAVIKQQQKSHALGVMIPALSGDWQARYSIMIRNLLLQVLIDASSNLAYAGLALAYYTLSVTHAVVALSQSLEDFASCRFGDCHI
jgi:hypothetical protein